MWKKRRVGGQKDIVMWNVLIKDIQQWFVQECEYVYIITVCSPEMLWKDQPESLHSENLRDFKSHAAPLR